MANEQITKALIQLAVATREHIDAGVIALYEEDTAEFAPDIIVEACQQLRRTSVWFPRVSELREVCTTIRAGRRILAQARLSPPLPPPMTPEQAAKGVAMRDKFLADLRAMARAKRMPSHE